MGYYQGDYYQAGGLFDIVKSAAGFLGGKRLTGLPAAMGAAHQVFGPPGLGALGSTAPFGAALPLGLLGPTMAARAAAANAGTPGVVAALSAGGVRVGRRYRRMNVANVRALRRSMRRVQGFAKLAQHTIGFTKRVHMKKRRRR